MPLNREEKREERLAAARIFEHCLRRIVNAYRDIPDWEEWWDHEIKEAEKALREYGTWRRGK